MKDLTPQGSVPPQLTNTRDLLDHISKYLDALPGPIQKHLRRELHELKELVLDQRAPRILIIGRRGSGKSSLVNAIFEAPLAEVGSVRAQTGKGTWYTYSSGRGELRILDTRGFGDATRPDAAERVTAEEEILEAISAEAPDVLLFLCKAKEIDSRIGEDIESMLSIHRHIAKLHHYQSPIVGLVTQVDELDPLRVGPPFLDELKKQHIEEACAQLEQAFTKAGKEAERIYPIATYLEFDGEQIVDQKLWNIDRLLEYLVEALPSNARLMMARTSRVRAAQRRLAGDLVKKATAVSSGIAAVPIPLADTIPLTAIQIAMISSIGYLAGRSMSKKTAAEFISAMGLNVGAGMAFRELARGLLKLIPGAGSVISAAVAGAGTWALGQAAIFYFLEGKSAEEAKARFENAKAEELPSSALAQYEESADGQ